MMSLAAFVFAAASGVTAQAPIVMDGPCPDTGDDDYFDLPFEVPDGTQEIEVAHAPRHDNDVLDWGVYGPSGEYRGWGGGKLGDAIIGVEASSTSYLPGPIPPGTWTVNVGKARIHSGDCGYHVEITLRTTPTLTPLGDRSPYVEAPAFVDKPGFYAGDFHVHSEDSGDARPPLDEIAQLAISKGLDFVVITDHNTTAQVDRLVAAQVRNPELLMLPGVEFTTYGGHATGFGATRYVDHRIGHNGRTVQQAIDEFAAQGALFSINHPALDLGDVCIGCAWTHGDPDVGTFQGVEIETQGYDEAGGLFTDKALLFWEDLLDKGNHLAALGGSDDHQAGQGNTRGVGTPCTLVFAQSLSQEGIKQAILDSRTVVKLQDCDAPMIALDTDPPRTGDTAIGESVTVTATVTGGVGDKFHFIENGLGTEQPVTIDKDPQVFTLTRAPDDSGTDRVRGEVVAADDHPLTETSYVWLKAGPPAGCGCREGSTLPAWFALFFLGALGFRRRSIARVDRADLAS